METSVFPTPSPRPPIPVMHCGKCNIDFPEGLRYCKWCGEALVDHPRVTSELHTCPSCAVAVKPGWAFCKSCGERLGATPSEPANTACPECGAKIEAGARTCPRCGEDFTGQRADKIAQSPDTVMIAGCPSCGEPVDAGTLYCKACGSAVYNQETPFGESAALCGECNSYSPYGSRVCRVCGAPFAQASKTVVDRPAFVPHLPDAPRQPETDGDAQYIAGHSSGASTVVFGESERAEGLTEASPPKHSVQTSVLPGTAGSKSEQPAQTSIVQMGRITGPVEEDEAPVEGPASSSALELITANDVLDETTNVRVQSESSAKQGMVLETTTGFSSEPESSPASADVGAEIFASPLSPSVSGSFDRASQDDVRTREMVRPSPHAQPTSQQAGASEQTSGQLAEANVTRDMSSAGAAGFPFEQAPSQPLQRKRTGVLIASAAVVVIVILGAVVVGYWLLFARGPATRQPATSAKVEQPTAMPAPPTIPAAPAAPEGMLAIAAGSYTIGRNGADPLEQPQHKVDLPAFFIDRSEVTNEAYKKFVDATGHKPPTNWSGESFPNGRDRSPVTGITWQDASDYAAWAGKRLPSEDEWEAAARGADGRIYPWGNEWRAGLANIGSKPDDINAEQYPSGIKEVGQYPQGASPPGALDMIGNAWEWVADVIAAYPGNAEAKPTLKPGVDYRVIRGGAYDGNKTHDATYRGYLDASQAYPKVGFRCAKDAK